MKVNLATRLFLSYLVVLLIGVIILAAVAQFSLPRAYGRHLGTMDEVMGRNMMFMAGEGRGNNPAARGLTFLNFRTSFFEALGLAILSGMAVALLVSWLISRSIVSPLRAMTLASRRIAEGEYSQRVPIHNRDELGQLAGSFNTMAEKLDQVEAMRRRLIGDVAHELRTPLTVIKGSMEALQDGVIPATPETYAQVAAEADRLGRLVDDLQEVSRVESGELNLNFEPVSIPDLAATVKNRLAPVYEQKGVSLDIQILPELPFVRADVDRLLQVLTNLLNNALQYTPEGGEVALSARLQGRNALFRVTDNGIGIPPEHLSHVFDRFYRVDRSRSRQSGGGSGVGLTICRHLVEAHGGRIWVESGGEGQGSAFSFTIPLA